MYQNNQSVDGSGRGGGGGFSITHSFGRINHDELSMKKTSLSPPLDDISVTNIAFAAFGYSKRIMDTKCGPTIAVYTISIMSQKLHFPFTQLAGEIFGYKQ